MKLSNTMLISRDLLPNYNKAFTLAEVLITLTILGVVAAITIPSLINRQSEVAAKTRIKKAIATYENVAAQVMAEEEANNAHLLTNYADYFKVVQESDDGFKTQDGTWWTINSDGNAFVCDSANPTFCVTMWTGNNNVNGDDMYGVLPAEQIDGVTLPDNVTIMSAADFMQVY